MGQGVGGARWGCVPLLALAWLLSTAAQPEGKARIYWLRVTSDIKFHFATTLVSCRLLNPSPSPAQAAFQVTLPSHAFISNFTLETGGQVYPGKVKEKEVAQKEFDRAKKRGQSAGQVKHKPRETNRFSVEINVAGEDKVTFNLTYQEVLQRRLGVYEHVVYIEPGQAVEEMEVQVFIEENRQITYLQVPPLREDLLTQPDLTSQQSGVDVMRPALNRAVIRYSPSLQQQQLTSDAGLKGLFTVRYDVDRTAQAGDLLVVNGYFVHFFAPAVDKPVPKDVVFILDTSTSMTGEKLQQLKDAMQSILGEMQAEDRFAVMEFNSRTTLWKPELVAATPSHVRQAIRYVHNRKPRGFTNVDKALKAGLGFLSSQNRGGRGSMLIFLTDGVPTSGESNSGRIVENAVRLNRGEAPIYSLAFGADADWSLVKKLAASNNGLARRIYQDSDSALQIEGFYKEVSTMLMTGLQAQYLGDAVDPASLTQATFKSYLNGSELLIAGRLLDTAAQSLAVNIRATDVSGGINLTSTATTTDLDLDSLAPSPLMHPQQLAEITQKMWAYLTLKQLLKRQVGEADPQQKEQLKQRAVDLSLKYGLVTPVTSLIVTKPEEKGEVGELDEDDSDLQDDADVTLRPAAARPTAARPRGGRRGGGGGGSRGGGGGDPHFMMQLASLPYPLCFDVDGSTGQAFQLLHDPATGLTVNMELGEGRRRRLHPLKHGSLYRTYMLKVAVLLGDTVLRASLHAVHLNQRRLAWGRTRSLPVPGATLLMTGDQLTLTLDSGVQVLVRRWSHPAANTLGQDFLSVQLENEQRLSPHTDGILGQFAHRTIRMGGRREKGGKTLIHLKAEGGQHGAAFLTQRRDPSSHRATPCLMLHKPGLPLLTHPTRHYRVASLLSV